MSSILGQEFPAHTRPDVGPISAEGKTHYAIADDMFHIARLAREIGDPEFAKAMSERSHDEYRRGDDYNPVFQLIILGE